MNARALNPMHYHDSYIQKEQLRQQLKALYARIKVGKRWWMPSLLSWAAKKGFRGWLKLPGESTVTVLTEYIQHYKL